jgi:hypothetical protein
MPIYRPQQSPTARILMHLTAPSHFFSRPQLLTRT